MATKRKAISKKDRFEIFKRDNFTCQYCGKLAPNVVLEIDHIHPVSGGGSNDYSNLITSCFDCNRGKGMRKLNDDTMIQSENEAIQKLASRREQIEMLKKWRDELLEFKENEVDVVCETICLICDEKVHVTDHGKKTIKDLIRRFGIEETIICCEMAFEKYPDLQDAFSKIGGIAYNRKYRQGEENGH